MSQPMVGPFLSAQAVGPIAGKCDGVDFEISGQQVTAKDLSTCGIQGAEYDVPGMDGMGWAGDELFPWVFHRFSMGFPWVSMGFPGFPWVKCPEISVAFEFQEAVVEFPSSIPEIPFVSSPQGQVLFRPGSVRCTGAPVETNRPRIWSWHAGDEVFTSSMFRKG